ncbi:MAG: hypothetical protein ACKVU1_01910 [bacterium]
MSEPYERAERAERAEPKDPGGKDAGKSIGALYRKMSSWYIVFSLVVFVFILFVGFQLARPLIPFLIGDGN